MCLLVEDIYMNGNREGFGSAVSQLHSHGVTHTHTHTQYMRFLLFMPHSPSAMPVVTASTSDDLTTDRNIATQLGQQRFQMCLSHHQVCWVSKSVANGFEYCLFFVPCSSRCHQWHSVKCNCSWYPICHFSTNCFLLQGNRAHFSRCCSLQQLWISEWGKWHREADSDSASG